MFITGLGIALLGVTGLVVTLVWATVTNDPSPVPPQQFFMSAATLASGPFRLMGWGLSARRRFDGKEVMCDHLNCTTNTLCYHYPQDDGSMAHGVHVSVKCSDCGAPFRFLGDNPGQPSDVAEAMGRKLGAWTSDMGDELGCLISAIDGEGLGVMAVAGRA